MDLISHYLAGRLTSKLNWVKNKSLFGGILLGALLPDIGEVFLQIALSKKYNEPFGVYDERTSDIEIASDLSVTWIYDLSHSIPFMILFLALSFALKNGLIKKKFFGFSMGLITHLLLDFCTHGHVWALKLFFPFSNHRFKIFADSVGNWWDWEPKITLPLSGFEFPIYCIIFWLVMIFSTFLIKKIKF